MTNTTCPQDNLILFNLSYVLRHLATSTLRDEKSGLEDVVSAVRNLELAQRFFTMLSKATEKQKYDLNHAGAEARQCTDLLSQAQYHVARARKLDDEQRVIR